MKTIIEGPTVVVLCPSCNNLLAVCKIKSREKNHLEAVLASMQEVANQHKASIQYVSEEETFPSTAFCSCIIR